MNVERNMPVVRERKLAILKGDPELCDQQKKAGKLIARERIGLLLDAASFVELDVLNSEAGVVTGYGLINGSPVYVYAQDFTVKGGSVGADHARKVLKVMNLAEKTGAPIVAILDTAGARLDEGIDAMNAYAQTGWIAAHFFCEGLRRIEGQDITWENYMNALETGGYIQNPFGGKIDYADGVRAGTQEMNLAKINPDVEGGWELVDGLQSMESLLAAAK